LPKASLLRGERDIGNLGLQGEGKRQVVDGVEVTLNDRNLYTS